MTTMASTSKRLATLKRVFMNKQGEFNALVHIS